MAGAGSFPQVGTHYPDTSLAEDVTDVIYQITPEDKPMFVMTGDTTISNPYHQWQVRALTTRQPNAEPEGFTYTFTAGMTTPVRQGNNAQIFAKEIRVSETEQAVQHYAISDMYADQMEIRLAEVGTDIEHALIQGTQVTGNASLARSFDGFIRAIETTGLSGHATQPTAISMSETHFNDFIQACWDQGGEPRDVLTGGYMKRKISGFNAVNGTRYIPHDQGKVVNTISYYESDFFPVEIHLSRDVPRIGSPSGWSGYDLLLVDRTQVRKGWLRRMVSRRTPEIADSADGVIKGELTLEYGNAAAHMVVRSML